MTRLRTDRLHRPGVAGRLACVSVLLLGLAGCASEPVVEKSAEPTLADLPAGRVPAATGSVTGDGQQRAIEAYRDYLARYPDSPDRNDIRRRLADLLVKTAGYELVDLTATADMTDRRRSSAMQHYREAITLYEQLLREQPDHPGRSEIYYQLSKAYEETGQPERATAVLDTLITQHPPANTRLYSDALFRRGELQFDAGHYAAAEVSYHAVVELGSHVAVYEQSLYKLGWSRFRQAQYERALEAFFTLLDAMLPAGSVPEDQLDALPPADRELLADVFRAISLSFSYLDGADSITAWFRHSGPRHYEQRIYLDLAGLYDSKQLYTDAATTRLALADRVAGSALAPRLYIDVIRSYRQAGFQGRLMETHAAFVERYALENEFWRHHATADLPDVVRQLEDSLIELTQFHHARYVKEGTAGDYGEALRWYRTSLQMFPDTARTVEIHLQLAELLYARGDDAQAVPEYEQVAYGYGVHPRAAESGLNAVIACERLLQQAEVAGGEEWQSRCDALAIRFVANFPQHPDAAVVLSRTGAGLIERQQAEQASRVCRDILDRGDSVSPALRSAAWILLAQSSFSLQDYRAAEQAYREALAVGGLDVSRRTAVSQALASAIYRQAEQQQAQGDHAGASRSFLRAAEAAPGSPVQPVARYDAAAGLLEQEQWDEAARVLGQFRKEHPAHALQTEVTRKLAYAHVQAGRALDAAGEYEALAEVHDDSEIRREALLQAADLYRQAGHSDDAVMVLERYLARYPQPVGEAMEAMQQLAEIEAGRGNAERHQHWLQALIRSDAEADGDDRTRELAARARLALTDYRIAEFERLDLGEPLQKTLDSKLRAMEQAIGELEAAAAYGIADVTTAATYRTGDLYYALGQALLESPRPKGLSDEEQERYNLLLEEEAAPFEDRAIEFHEVNVRRIRAGQYDRWIEQSLAQLGELWPARYARAEQAGTLTGNAPGAAVANPDYRQAMTAMQAGQYAGAARLLEDLDGPAGESHAAQLNLAIAHVQLGNNADAGRVIHRVLAETPDDPVARNLQGILHRRAGRFRQARDAYEQALRLRPGYTMAHINLGILCDIYLQDTDCAMRHYRDYLRLSAGDDRRVALWLADLEQRQGDR